MTKLCVLRSPDHKKQGKDCSKIACPCRGIESRPAEPATSEPLTWNPLSLFSFAQFSKCESTARVTGRLLTSWFPQTYCQTPTSLPMSFILTAHARLPPRLPVTHLHRLRLSAATSLSLSRRAASSYNWKPPKDPMEGMTEAEKDEIRKDVGVQSARAFSFAYGIIGGGMAIAVSFCSGTATRRGTVRRVLGCPPFPFPAPLPDLGRKLSFSADAFSPSTSRCVEHVAADALGSRGALIRWA
ncbi:hypothetical protein BDK51DRAFT_38698 [Blyttiomyces helicus]|uniref:Uncharacterized protein n=1 Tax=Blyttiomyces helicus TaxID=388810 RepID=A0A4P9W7V7_9FUNG|nr:hypothetical protein BDK51DRAFT_38698 [Blyttiomyces helicus]|eukprot:RKO87493.1 hypothetical protein BDK51DRAFT_38698 [Blyttiomyces helicus]